MLGNFQQSELRIEVNASAAVIQGSLTLGPQLQAWLWPEILSPDLPEELYVGARFTNRLGLLNLVDHYVDIKEPGACASSSVLHWMGTTNCSGEMAGSNRG